MFALLTLLLILVHGSPPPAAPSQAPAPAAMQSPEDSPASSNFLVEASDPATSRQVETWAEKARREIQARWFPASGNPWPRPVRLVVSQENLGFAMTEITADGVVTIMVWAGDPELESTIRHEVWHAVVHQRYPKQPIPRWLDEGLAICNESVAEQQRQLAPLFKRERRFPVRDLIGFRNYPRDIALFYAQGYSLTDFLVRKHGEREVIRFLERSFAAGQEEALREVLGYPSVEALEKEWLDSLQPAKALRRAA